MSDEVHECPERISLNSGAHSDYPPAPEKERGRWVMIDNERFDWCVKFCPYCGDKLK